jgi:hypothetical protein
MYSSIARIVFALAALPAVTVMAATPGAELLKVRFPQPVHVRQAWLPAGDYTIRAFDNGSGTPLFAIASEHGDSVLVAARRVPTGPGSLSARSEVIFRDRDGKRELARIRFAGEDYAYLISK